MLMKGSHPGDDPMDTVIGNRYLGVLVWFETSHSGSAASPHMYKNSKVLINRRGGGLHKQPSAGSEK